MKVCKFGGSSLADASQVKKVCDIILADPDRRMVVVSAPGKRHAEDTKVTDLLIACAEAKTGEGDVDAAVARVVARYAEIIKELALPAELIEEISADLQRRVSAETTDRDRVFECMKAAGEDLNARLVAAALRTRGADARYVSPAEVGMLLTDECGNAQLLPESYENIVSALSDAKGLVVFPGFFGHTRQGEIITFPRGGSDITGAILASALKAEVYENFTDVDSVFSVDPRIVPDPAPITEVTYREMRELAYAGFGVLHDEAILPAVHAGVPICIKNTNAPASPGTRISLEREHSVGRVVGIASGDGFCTIFCGKYLMNREIGIGRRFLQIFEEEGLSYEHVPSGIDNLSIILKEDGLTPEAEAHVMGRIRDELGADDVWVEHGLSLIMIVGEGMRYAVGVAAKATAALAEANVSIEMMNQGSSEISMMFGVKSEDREQAVQSLYAAFFSD